MVQCNRLTVIDFTPKHVHILAFAYFFREKRNCSKLLPL